MVRYLVFAVTLAVTMPAIAEDEWHRAEFWGREYPSGFTMMEDASIDIRAEPEASIPRTIGCDLSKNATYHPWNEKRVEERKLKFVTLTKIRHYEISHKFGAQVRKDGSDVDTTIAFERGDKWEYLTYGAEGFFLFRFNGEVFVGSQELFEASAALDKVPEMSDGAEEYMQLTCDNGLSGWLRMLDVEGLPAFGAPNLPDYGRAEDKTD
jgi:hypothetical protein